jgi:hypothetical protein
VPQALALDKHHGMSTTNLDGSQQPVESKSTVATEKQEDCFHCMWEWAMCGGPRSRLKQLYVHGKLRRCMDDYTIFKECLMGKLHTRQEPLVKPHGHPLWNIRTRDEANQFWVEQYAHLGATRAAEAVQPAES